MRSLVLLGTMGLLLAACAAQPVPDSGAGVGFSDYAQYELERARSEATLTGTPTGSAPVAAVPPGGIPQTDLAAAGIGVAPIATGPIGSTPVAVTGAPLNATTLGAGDYQNRTAEVQATPGNAAPVLVTGSTTGISDEQDFAAVATRESIESDAARRAQQAAQYEVIQPTALPDAPSDTGPNIVAYALSAPNSRGQEWYSRAMLPNLGRFERNCATYRSPDEAQRDFLASGGPERDSRGIDPDGDGFACGWDPAPFLAAVGGN